MPKTYLSAEELRPLTDDARLCYASSVIIREGRLCGYMLREPPAFPADSGWRFFAGGETAGELWDESSGFYPLNTLCNYDPDILGLLEAPAGSAYVRTGKGFLPLSAISREMEAGSPAPGGRPAPSSRAGAPRGPIGRRPPSLSIRIAKGTYHRRHPTPVLRVRFSKNINLRHKFIKIHTKELGGKRRETQKKRGK